jgi:hypothetical protein
MLARYHERKGGRGFLKRRCRHSKKQNYHFSKHSSLCRQNITFCNATSKFTKKKKKKNILTTFLQYTQLESSRRQKGNVHVCHFVKKIGTNEAEIIELEKKMIFIIEI